MMRDQVVTTFALSLRLQEETIRDDVEFLVLASDGLWDVVSNQVSFQLLSISRARPRLGPLTMP
jgi:serine/threonine protein phosphatase PrpC